MTAHRQRLDRAIGPWMLPDPGLLNTSATGGILNDFTESEAFNLQIGSGAEIRNLPDPVNAGQWLTLSLTSRSSGGTLQIRFQTPPAIQSGSNNQFYATANNANSIGATLVVRSVPFPKASIVGSQSTVTNTTGFRWVMVVNDGFVTVT